MPYVNPITQPYGDITQAQTPRLDNTLNLIYQENKQREAKRAAEAAAIDDDMNKEYGKIRSVDIPEFTDKWSKYKALKQKVLFDKKLQRDPIAYQQAKRDADIALGEVYKHGNASKELLKGENDLDEWAKAHPYETSTDYDKHRGAVRSLKVGDVNNYQMGVDAQGKPIMGNALDRSLYVDNTPHFDFGKVIATAEGKPLPTGYYEDKAWGNDGLQTERVPHLYGGKPEQVRAAIVNSFSTANPKDNESSIKTAEGLGRKISKDDYYAVEQQYLAIPPDELKRRGISELKPFPEPKSNAEKYANFAAMQSALARPAIKGKSEIVDNKAAEMEMKRKDERAKADYDQKLKKNYYDYTEGQEGAWLKKHMEMYADAPSSGTELLKGLPNTSFKVLPMDNLLAKGFARDGREPDAVLLNPKTKEYTPVFYKKEKDSDGNMRLEGYSEKTPKPVPIVDEIMSQPISEEQARANLLMVAPKTKQAAIEMAGKGEGTKRTRISSTAPITSPTPTIKAKTTTKSVSGVNWK